MGNPLGPFSNTSDWPEWPNRHLWAFMATQNMVKWPTSNFSSEYARDLISVSIRRSLGMGNPLVQFSNTSDWPEWPNRHLWPFMATQNMVK